MRSEEHVRRQRIERYPYESFSFLLFLLFYTYFTTFLHSYLLSQPSISFLPYRSTTLSRYHHLLPTESELSLYLLLLTYLWGILAYRILFLQQVSVGNTISRYHHLLPTETYRILFLQQVMGPGVARLWPRLKRTHHEITDRVLPTHTLYTHTYRTTPIQNVLDLTFPDNPLQRTKVQRRQLTLMDY